MKRSMFVIGTLLAFLVGVFLGDLIKIDLWWLLGLVFGLVFMVAVFWRDLPWRFVVFCLIGFILGLGCFNFYDLKQKSVKLSFDKEKTFQGMVIGHPELAADSANYLIKEEDHIFQVRTGRFPEYRYGDVLEIKGTLKKSNDYFFHQKILGVIYNPQKIEKVGTSGNKFIGLIYSLRDRFEGVLSSTLNEPYASFAAGLVLGSKSNISDSLMSDFNRTGTTHIIAVSGYNVTIIIVYVGLFLGLFSRRWKFWGSLLFIFSFVVMTGAPASVVRAGILGCLVALGYFEGRRINMTILLLLVAAVMVLLNPYVLKYDISFQLSFLAFAGLIYLGPILQKKLSYPWMPDLFKSSLCETTAAQIAVLPLLIYYFGRVSIVSPLVNILILWIIPLTMLFIFLVGIIGLFWISVAEIVSAFSWILLRYILVIIESFSRISWASFELRIESWWWMPIVYSLVGLIIYKEQFKKTS